MFAELPSLSCPFESWGSVVIQDEHAFLPSTLPHRTRKSGAPGSLGIGGNAWEFIVLRADAGSFDSTESLASRTILFRSG